MPIIKYSSIVDELLKRPVFSANDLLVRGVSRSYIKRLANYLKSKKKIKIVEKGKYATVDNPFLVAPFITFPSYISMFSALFLRNAISQIPMAVQIVTTRRRKNKIITYNNTKIEFFKIKKSLFFGFEYIWHENYQIPVATIEKAIIDIYYFGYSIKGFEVDLSRVDCSILEDYLSIVSVNSLSKKIKEVVKC
ncbi:MAG: type IV toxin-antitoxin system AbiEi family antitoxin domain-containing protein [Candidatus Asgardarchaeia archaeon]